MTAEEAAAAVEEAVPGQGFGPMVLRAANSNAGLAAWIALLLTIIGMILTHADAQQSPPAPTVVQVETLPASVSTNDMDRIVRDIIQAMNLGRNDPCPCRSGKKVKRCHGQ